MIIIQDYVQFVYEKNFHDRSSWLTLHSSGHLSRTTSEPSAALWRSAAWRYPAVAFLLELVSSVTSRQCAGVDSCYSGGKQHSTQVNSVLNIPVCRSKNLITSDWSEHKQNRERCHWWRMFEFNCVVSSWCRVVVSFLQFTCRHQR